MTGGGHLTISTRSQESRNESFSEPRPLDVVFEITDTGGGMPPEVMAKAFDPFFTTKPLGHGTGLGLATVYGIVNRYDGTVVIDSLVGTGTTVTVVLPGTLEPVASVASTSGAPARGSERILLVEDETTLRIATARILIEHGYEVVSASDGVEALEIYDRNDGAFDLVLSDVAMPRMRGGELADELAKRSPALKIIMMTGYASGDPPSGSRILSKPWPRMTCSGCYAKSSTTKRRRSKGPFRER